MPFVWLATEVIAENGYDRYSPIWLAILLVAVVPAVGSVCLTVFACDSHVIARWIWALAWLVLIPVMLPVLAVLLVVFTGLEGCF